ncbi:hypothetical protein EFL95_04410 [Nocardioides marmorisolisilvae]|uniref:Uncharacterized protein n=1 Tax=Nocardioides marmorisolisilvae TaxID=1542737 RepID=A0A3N0DSK8_9ACTN|nr:hypothetical protein EFL95_04410 [Nocardioides marmorisolisilvae]
MLPLAACGSNVVPSSGEAHTMACRGYVLSVGDADTRHAKELLAEAPTDGDGIESDTVLVKVRGAAVTAGQTPGLSDDDFARFRALVEVVAGLPGKIKDLDDGTRVLGSADLVALTKAVAAVHKLCY